jgi:crotonobetainyl-CoA:carnitine CoA-transferase CaiB-like acyl-CoA transferase
MTALAGIKVLELARVLAGPWCGMTLADLGADVIKVEPPAGDDTRGWGPPFRDGLSAYFACCNRNKRSIALDLRLPESRPIIEALIRQSDILIENYRTGSAETLGVDYASAKKLNPKIIYCSISGYGRTGPDADKPGYDFAIQAEAGLMSITGAVDDMPYRTGTAVADIATGQNAAMAILAALIHRMKTGEGQACEISLFDSQLQLLANSASTVLFSGNDARRLGNQHPSIVPYQIFSANDGYFVLAVASEKLWRDCCTALQKEVWLQDARYLDNAARVANRDPLIADMQKIFASESLSHWQNLFEKSGIPIAPINSVQQAIEHPVTTARDMRIECENVPMIGSPLKLGQTPVSYRLPPPKLDADRDIILNELRHQGLIA